MNKHKIAIYGAGSIGCYVGGRLAQAGADIDFIGRDKIGSQLRQFGLHITDLEGCDFKLTPEQFSFSTSATDLSDAGMVIVCVKSAATEEVAKTLAALLSPGTLVLSLQNGLSNADVLRQHLNECTVLTGIVEFNVVNHGQGRFHQGSEGTLESEAADGLDEFLPLFEKAGLPILVHQAMLPVQWAKLLLNLNNPINALSNLPLKEELSQRAFRRCIALAQAEALSLLDMTDIKPTRITPLPPHWIPKLLTVPDWLFRLLGNKMLAIDPLARSSMWEDLEAGRKTEIDWINGEVLNLAQKLGQAAPINQRLIQLIRDAEAGGRRDWTGVELLRELQTAS